jgi:adenylate kinase family enzyme
MKVVVTVGLPGSGKSSHVKIIGEKYGFPQLETGQILLGEMSEKGIEVTSDNIKKFTEEKKRISDAYFTERAVEIVKFQYKDKRVVFLSGMRAPSEIDFLRKKFGENNVFVIAFLASRKSRYERVAQPKAGFDYVGKSTRESEKKDSKKAKEDKILASYDEFVKKDLKELSFGEGDVISSADYFVITESGKYPNKSWEATNKEVEEIIKEIMEQ